MSPQVIVAKENTNAEAIGARLLAGEFNGVPVVDNNGAVIGIVTAIDILKAIRKNGNKKLNAIVAKDIMTQKEIVLVPVIEDGNNNKLLGVVARLDIIRQKLNEDFIVIEKREAVART